MKIFYNGTVYTGEGFVAAFAVEDGRFVAVGDEPLALESERVDLDRVSTEFPVCATRACGHALVINSKALEMLGITADTPSPEGGEIDFENGRFFDNAMDMVLGAIPPRPVSPWAR